MWLQEHSGMNSIINVIISRELSFREVHFRMCIHECLKFILLILFLWCWQSFLFLLLIKHHLFNYSSCFTIQIWKFRVFRLDLLSIDQRITFNYTVPPILSFKLSKCDLKTSLWAISLDCPKWVILLDFSMKFTINNWGLTLHSYLKSLRLHNNV